jgi:Fe-S cluster assembly iron-binding protein IscA
MHKIFNGGKKMIEVTKSAIQEIKNFFADKDIMPIRVFVASGG